MNSAIGPYKGALRFHPSVNQSILKFLAFEQTFKNALTTMPCAPEAVDIFLERNVLFASGKAANTGGVAVCGLELVQNSMRLNWLGEEVDQRLKIIMKGIHNTCL
jgi:glutamate dehydrogenase/leucine dehydrogenase